eukprot:TRINITY_DN7246_c0_g1_i1.p1 TRINITY_DN7246_c0_g1~~TRINITY_DN7246_c0_g1_i1.p1  ORF type:complete len:537 (+),score=178.41 TRINITY_DN7246_c0_g1_i1:38-1648(+)
MQPYKTKVNKVSSQYQENYKRNQELVADLNTQLGKALEQGKPEHIRRHIEGGRLLARDRIELLLDQDSPFLELCPLAGLGKDNTPLGGSVVCGIGLVSGVECLISANVPTINGGSVNRTTLKKFGRIDQIITENRLPAISLVETGGADLRQQAKVFHAGGAGFRSLTRRSKDGLPSISVVFGSSTAGGAYTPGMSDYVIMVKNQAKVFLGGPPLVKAATGEVTDAETLGGAEMHSRVSGVSDYLAEDEHHALYLCRQVVASLNWRKKTPFPGGYLARKIDAPLYDPDELLGIVSPDVRLPFEAREVIARLVDGSRFNEFKPSYGSTLVTAWAEVHGFPIGIIANNGVIFPDTANKATQFIEICERRVIPLLYLHNVTGFMVGKKYEHEGIIKHGSKMINAVANCELPAISIIMGASYGAGNYAMCGRAYNPRFLFTWPNSKVAVMGSDQLAGVMVTIQRDAAEKSGRKFNEEAAAQMSKMFKDKVDSETTAYYCTSRMIDDGIVDPRQTRDILGLCLSVIYTNEIKPSGRYGLHRM